MLATARAPAPAFTAPRCPTCHELANGFFELVRYRTPIVVADDGTWDEDYDIAGETDETIGPFRTEGLYTLACPNDHEWLAGRTDEPVLTGSKQVLWVIDYAGDPEASPREIARWALARQRDPASIATVFAIVDPSDGSRTVVDLEEDQEVG